MKSIYILFVFFSCSILAQIKLFDKEAELQQFVERGGKVEELSPNCYKLTYIDGTQKEFNFISASHQNNYTEDFDTTIINVWEIDTTLYADKFKFWQSVDFTTYSATETAPIDDINNNGLLEWYGGIWINYPFQTNVVILEQNNNGIFNTVYTYDSSSIGVSAIGDVNSDGIKEVYLKTIDTLNGKFYKADSLGAFPTTFDFIFYYYTTAQIYDMTFGDFDKNNVTDCAFMDWPIFIATFDSSIDNFSEVAQFDVNDDASGFAINDFDEDGKTELVIGTGLHGVYVIEAEDINQYSIVWNGLAPSVNAYMITSTEDIDDNGKPEFWVGGMDFTAGISTFWCYETDGDNSYIPVAGIELRYLVSLFSFHLQVVDIDNDGKKELVVNIGNHLLILNFTGKPNQHSYDIYYAKIDEATQPVQFFLPSTIRDFNRDGRKDILLSMAVWPPPYLSYILLQDTVTSVADNDIHIPGNFNLSQNYPNPFNPSTMTKVIVKEQSKIQITIYNVLGKEIKTLLNENLPSGEYPIEWNGKDNEGNDLPGGIYFIQMIAGDYKKTIKTILLK
ncbi:MAG: FlgD immunoglobulin-like domain containing protein [Ignavibacteriaceae bacterium]